MARKPVKRKPAARGKLTDPLAAVRAGDLNGALAALLARWRTAPTAQLADVIAAVSRKAKPPGVLRGKTAAARAAWNARAAAAQPSDVGPLLDGLADVSSGEALKRLTHVKRWLPDPRVDAALVDLVFAVPYRATSTQPFWKRLFALGRDITDRRQLARLWSWDGQGIALTMQTWLRAQVTALLSAHDSVGPEAEALHAERDFDPDLEQIALALGPKVSIGSRNLEALLQAIADAPDDDAPRLVYADALLERGDPRGEFINLQIAGSGERDARRRETELLQTYGKQWLGELRSIVMTGYQFERGFLAVCKVDNKHMDRVRKLVGHPAWSTVHTLEGSAAIALDPVMRSLRNFVFDATVARNHEGLPDSWRDLLIGTERPIESLTYTGIESDRQWENALEANQSVRPGVQGRWVHVPQVMELAALCSCSALPKLHTLTVRERPEIVVEPLLRSDVIARLTTLGFVFDAPGGRTVPLGSDWGAAPTVPPLGAFAALIAAAPVPVLRLTLSPLFHTTTVELVREGRGYRRLAMTLGPKLAPGAARNARPTWSAMLVAEAIAIMDAMPPSVREVRIATTNLEPQQLSRLRAAATQRSGLDVCDVS